MRTLQPARGVVEGHLSRMPVFGGLCERDLGRVASGARLCIAERGEPLFRSGEPASELFCLAGGSVRVFRSDPEGREKVIHLLSPPALVAEVPVFMGTRYPACADCGDESLLVVVPRGVLAGAIQRDPELSMQLLGAAMGRLRELTAQLVSHSGKSATGRVAIYLLGLSRGDDEVALPAQKKDVANYLGLQPESLSRALAALVRAGAIRVDGQVVRVLDRGRLTEAVTAK